MRARDNPFAVDRVLAVRYKPQGCTWDELLARLKSLRYRAAIVGPHGTGKTTLLEDLAPRLRSRGFLTTFVRLDSTEPRLGPNQWEQVDAAGAGHVLLLDGAEQLSLPQWLRLRFRARRAGGLVITTHRPGRLPTLLRTSTSPALLSQILDELGIPFDAAELFARHRGNLRNALWDLYDRCGTGFGRSVSPMTTKLPASCMHQGRPATKMPCRLRDARGTQ